MRSIRSDHSTWTGRHLQLCPKGRATGVGRRQAMAFCSGAVGTHFREQPVHRVVPGRALRELAATLAFGAVAVGETEVLGTWPAGAVGQALWRGIWECLGSQGVEKEMLACASYPDACNLCLAIQFLQPFQVISGQWPVPETFRVFVLYVEALHLIREGSGVRVARISQERLLSGLGESESGVLTLECSASLEQCQLFYARLPEQQDGMLVRAVRPHGPFADMDAAVPFVTWTLAWFEARTALVELAPLPFLSHPVGRSAVLAAVRPDLAALVPAFSV